MAKLEDITTPSLTFTEDAGAATPASGRVVVYSKADGLMYSKDDAGAETLLSSGAITGLLDETAHDLLDHAGLTGIPSITGLLDETAHDLLDHAGLTGIPSVTGLLDETAHDLLDHTGLTGCGGTGSTAFVGLTDVPAAYTDQGEKFVAVKADETGLEFSSAPPLPTTSLTDYAENAGGHSGLVFAYKAGRVRSGTSVSTTAAGTVTLADDDTSYVEVDPATGIVTDNVTGFTFGSIPLFEVTTATGAITGVVDKRCFFSVAGGGGRPEVHCVAYAQDTWATSTSISVVVPDSVVEGDYLVVGLHARSAVTPADGFVKITEQLEPSSVQTTYVYWRVATSDDAGATLTFSQATSLNIAITLFVLACATGIVVEDYDSVGTTGKTTFPAVSSSGTGRLAILVCGNRYALISPNNTVIYIYRNNWANVTSLRGILYALCAGYTPNVGSGAVTAPAGIDVNTTVSLGIIMVVFAPGT